jgi:hypothetical protein
MPKNTKKESANKEHPTKQEVKEEDDMKKEFIEETVKEEIPESPSETNKPKNTTKAEKTIKKKSKSTRTPSSYVLFSMEYRKEIGKEFPKLSLGEVSKKCGEKWSSLSDEEKSEWKSKADVLRAESNPVKEAPEKKRKPSSYLMFSMEYRKVVTQESPELSLGEISKRCGAKWKELSEEEKNSWKQKAESA